MSQSNVHPADALLALKARVADLEVLMKVEHARLVAMGAGAHDGDIARANVIIAPRNTIDWKSIAQTLKPSLALPRAKWSDQICDMVDANTSTTSVTTVRVAARLGVIAA